MVCYTTPVKEKNEELVEFYPIPYDNDNDTFNKDKVIILSNEFYEDIDNVKFWFDFIKLMSGKITYFETMPKYKSLFSAEFKIYKQYQWLTNMRLYANQYYGPVLDTHPQMIACINEEGIDMAYKILSHKIVASVEDKNNYEILKNADDTFHDRLKKEILNNDLQEVILSVFYDVSKWYKVSYTTNDLINETRNKIVNYYKTYKKLKEENILITNKDELIYEKYCLCVYLINNDEINEKINSMIDTNILSKDDKLDTIKIKNKRFNKKNVISRLWYDIKHYIKKCLIWLLVVIIASAIDYFCGDYIKKFFYNDTKLEVASEANSKIID